MGSLTSGWSSGAGLPPFRLLPLLYSLLGRMHQNRGSTRKRKRKSYQYTVTSEAMFDHDLVNVIRVVSQSISDHLGLNH